jgi:8-oxo-dGTP diphosphatase
MFSVCADIAVVHNFDILTIVRGTEPFKGSKALPGGHMNVGESLPECAQRELKEETGVDVPIECLHFVEMFTNPDRDPSGNKLSGLFLYLHEGDKKPEVKAMDDVVNYEWVNIYDILCGQHKLAFDHLDMVISVFNELEIINN